jgi:hypothetical protein
MVYRHQLMRGQFSSDCSPQAGVPAVEKKMAEEEYVVFIQCIQS